MKPDRKLYFAMVILIGLVIWLIYISSDRPSRNDIRNALAEIKQLKDQRASKPADGRDGHTPILGLDYTVRNGDNGHNGANGTNGSTPVSIPGPIGPSNYDLARQDGFTGSLGEWLESLKVKGDSGPAGKTPIIDCIDSRLVQKYDGDAFYQYTNIKCENINE